MGHLNPQQPEIKHHPQGGGDAVVGDDALPLNLDPARCPIIAAHFYGWRPVGVVAAQIVQDLKYRRKVKRLVAKGDRVVGEMLAEIAADRNLGTVINELLDRYLAIPDEALDIANGRDFPPAPLHVIQDG